MLKGRAMKHQLGKIEKVDLRKVWNHEALDFTKWLAESDNLMMLGQEIGVSLELIETESMVGQFHADIFAQEVGTGRKVVIENQLEDTNHDHLGKIITYASGKGAEIVVWIVKRARDEHRQAIEWLNRHTDSAFAFFLIEVELWSINGSDPAVRFNCVERPNEWAKSMKGFEGLSDTKKLQLEYWQTYREQARGYAPFSSKLNTQKPAPQHWTNVHIGSSEYLLELDALVQKKCVSVGLYINENKEIYEHLCQNLSLFEDRIGCKGELFDAKKASGVRFYRRNCDIKAHRNCWPEYIKWQLDTALAICQIVEEIEL